MGGGVEIEAIFWRSKAKFLLDSPSRSSPLSDFAIWRRLLIVVRIRHVFAIQNQTVDNQFSHLAHKSKPETSPESIKGHFLANKLNKGAKQGKWRKQEKNECLPAASCGEICHRVRDQIVKVDGRAEAVRLWCLEYCLWNSTLYCPNYVMELIIHSSFVRNFPKTRSRSSAIRRIKTSFFYPIFTRFCGRFYALFVLSVLFYVCSRWPLKTTKAPRWNP